MLHQDGRLAADSVVRVAVEMVDRHEYSLEALRNSLQDLLRRGRLSVETVRQLGAAIADGQGRGGSAAGARLAARTRDLLRFRWLCSLRDLGPSADTRGSCQLGRRRSADHRLTLKALEKTCRAIVR